MCFTPGEALETPVFYGGYSNHGLGGASRLLHHFEIDHVLPRRPGQENGRQAEAGDLQLLGGHRIPRG